MLAMTGLANAIGLFVLLLWAALKMVPLSEVFLYGFSALILLLSFYLLMRYKLQLQLNDSDLQLPQIWLTLLLQGIFAVRLPALETVFAFTSLIVMVFAALQFHVPRYLVLWAQLSTASCLITTFFIYQYPQQFNALRSYQDWLYFAMLSGCLTFISARISYLRDIVRERNRNMSATLSRYRQLLSHDELTHALSRRFFMEVLSQTVAQAERYDSGFCVAMLDLDHFKRVNDQYGHPVGDAVLRAVCEAAWSTLRQVDQIGRYGGEEFAVLLPQCPLSDALVVLERVREAIANTHLGHLAPHLKMTISIGVTAYRTRDNVNNLLERADQALYQAKQAGRNRIKSL